MQNHKNGGSKIDFSIESPDSLLSSPNQHQNLGQGTLLVHDSFSSTVTDDWKPFSKLIILKNLSVICISVLLAFTAFEALMTLQSTINATENIGTYGLAVKYATFGFSCLALSSFVIEKLGCKLTLVFSLFLVSPYVAANFYPTWWTLIPTAVLCGLAAGPFWAARSAYVNDLSFRYASHIKDPTSVTNAFFFGVSCMAYQGAQVLGNLISFQVLKPNNDSFVDYDALDTCGASFCNEMSNANDSSLASLNSNLDPPTNEQRYTLIGIFLLCSILASFVMWLFLDVLHPLSQYKDENCMKKTKPRTLIFATFKQLKEKKQVLLIPLTVHIGLSDGFLFSDFTKAYIGCAWKIYHVGYVMMTYGASSCVMSLVSAILVKYLGRTAVFISSGIICALMYIFLLVWRPNPDNPMPFFVVVSAWGLVDATWWSHIAALQGLLFKNSQEASFSSFFFLTACGFLIAYGYADLICVESKIYILISVLTIGLVGYLIVEGTTDTTSPNVDDGETKRCTKEEKYSPQEIDYSNELQI